jgi:hypothetical protein
MVFFAIIIIFDYITSSSTQKLAMWIVHLHDLCANKFEHLESTLRTYLLYNKSIILWWEFIGCNKYWRILKFDQFDFEIWWACFDKIRVTKICNLSFFGVFKYLFLYWSSKARSRYNKIKHSTPLKSLDIFNRNNHPYSPYIFLPCYFNSSYGESVSKALILVVKTYLNTSKLLVLIEKKNSTNTNTSFCFLFVLRVGRVYSCMGKRKVRRFRKQEAWNTIGKFPHWDWKE